MTVKELQAALAAAGFAPGPIDGVAGPRTREALMRAAEAGRVEIRQPAATAGPFTDPPWLTFARTYIGTQEIAGNRHNPHVVAWWKEIGAPWFEDDETPWCAGFVGAMLEKAGIRSSRSAAARSYEGWGRALAEPAFGCVAVFARAGGGHVGFVAGRDRAGNLMILGGNQSNAVNIKPFGRDRLLGYRWPASLPSPAPGLLLLDSDGRLSTDEA